LGNEKDIGKTTVDSWRHEPRQSNYTLFKFVMKYRLLFLLIFIFKCSPKICYEYSCYTDVFHQLLIEYSLFFNEHKRIFIDSVLIGDSIEFNCVNFVSSKYRKDRNSLILDIDLHDVRGKLYIFRVSLYQPTDEKNLRIVEAYPYHRKFRLVKHKFLMVK